MTASYRYGAFSRSGEVVTGNIDAPSQADALRLLHDRGMLPFEAVEQGRARPIFALPIGKWAMRRIGLAARAELVRDLATLINSDIAIDRALLILSESAAARGPGAIVGACSEGVAAGRSLSLSLAAAGGGFRDDEIAMIAAGEENGSLAAVLDQLASLLERRVEIAHRLSSALIYPALLVAMALVSIFVILTVLIPNIRPLFEGSDMQLPVVVRMLVAMEDWAAAWWPVALAALTAIALAAVWLLRRLDFRRAVGSFALRLPLLGELMRKAVVSRVCRTLATLLKSGVPLQQSLAATQKVARNAVAERILTEALEQVVAGKRLSQALADGRLFDKPAIRLMALGEETNRLPQMLFHVAATTEARLLRQIERGMTLLTPALTLMLGVMIGGLIMSVMQAVLSINEIAIK